jgi:hypothetical protein
MSSALVFIPSLQEQRLVGAGGFARQRGGCDSPGRGGCSTWSYWFVTRHMQVCVLFT